MTVIASNKAVTNKVLANEEITDVKAGDVIYLYANKAKRLKTVSYTHLDVYKRQMLTSTQEQQSHSQEKAEQTTTTSTHRLQAMNDRESNEPCQT